MLVPDNVESRLPSRNVLSHAQANKAAMERQREREEEMKFARGEVSFKPTRVADTSPRAPHLINGDFNVSSDRQASGESHGSNSKAEDKCAQGSKGSSDESHLDSVLPFDRSAPSNSSIPGTPSTGMPGYTDERRVTPPQGDKHTKLDRMLSKGSVSSKSVSFVGGQTPLKEFASGLSPKAKRGSGDSAETAAGPSTVRLASGPSTAVAWVDDKVHSLDAEEPQSPGSMQENAYGQEPQSPGLWHPKGPQSPTWPKKGPQPPDGSPRLTSGEDAPSVPTAADVQHGRQGGDDFFDLLRRLGEVYARDSGNAEAMNPTPIGNARMASRGSALQFSTSQAKPKSEKRGSALALKRGSAVEAMQMYGAQSMCSKYGDPRAASQDKTADAQAVKRHRTSLQEGASSIFRLHPAFTEQPQNNVLNRKISFAHVRSQNSATRKSTSDPTMLDSSNEYIRWLIWTPGSPKRLSWEILGMVFLVYDVVTIPFFAAFAPANTILNTIITWSTLLFWTSDMGATLITGFQEGNNTILLPRRIAWRYVTTWLLMDVFLVGLDWYILMSENAAGNEDERRMGRSLRMLRFARIVRLVRLIKMKRFLSTIQDLINNEAISIAFSILKNIMFLLVANHTIACGWYVTGSVGAGNGTTWVLTHEMANRDVTYRYLTSLHWSLTQFTPASMEIFATNKMERLYSVVTLLFAMVAFSSFVSILTGSMIELRRITSDESRQFWLLRRYLHDWKVRMVAVHRVQRYCEYAYHRQKQRVQERDVGLLSLLSEPLREELKHETFSSHIALHPLFMQLNDKMRVFVRAINCTLLARHDPIFASGDNAVAVYFAIQGTLEYTPCVFEDFEQEMDVLQKATAADGLEVNMGNTLTENMSDGEEDEDGPSEDVEINQWVGEAVLWCPWLHLGELRTQTESQIISIDFDGFAEAVGSNRPLWLAVQKYAERFIQALNAVDQRDLTDIVDNMFEMDDLIDAEEMGIAVTDSQSGVAKTRSVKSRAAVRESYAAVKESFLHSRCGRRFFGASQPADHAADGKRGSNRGAKRRSSHG
jgi:hypothetical protein